MPTAIVIEGGGQRGIYAAGILDSFLRERFNPFTLGVAVSAGAQNLLSYFLDEKGYARRAIVELTGAPDFFVPYRWLGKRNIIDLDAYFEHSINDPDFLLPYQRIDRLQNQRRLKFVATCKESLRPVYLEPDSATALNYLKASSAVPFLYKEGVEIEGRVLVDGGIADPLPVQHAYGQGVNRLLVICSAPQDDNASSWRSRLTNLGITRALPKTVQQMIDAHEIAYAEAQNFIRNPPDGLELKLLAPLQPLQSFVFGSRSEALAADYLTGQIAGQQALKTLAHWQTAQSSRGSETLKLAELQE